MKRKYPRTEFPVLKLVGLPLFNHKTPRQGLISKPDVLNPAVDLRAAMNINDAAAVKELVAQTPDKKALNKGLVKRVDGTEVISQKLNMLTVYLQLLLKIPEIIMSTEILDFFDINTVDGNYIEELAEADLSCIDIMLSDQPKVNKTVGTRFVLPVSDLDETDLVLWSFTSRRKDIGFSVEFNGNVVAPYQRVESHKEVIQSSFEVPAGTISGDANLIWDNTYSRLVSKYITYCVKVVKKSDYVQAMELAREAQKQRAESSQQREYLRTVLAQLAKAVLGAAGADSFNSCAVNNSTGTLSTSNSSDDLTTGTRTGSHSRSGLGSGAGSGFSDTSSSTNAPSSAAVPHTTNLNDKKDEEIARLCDEKKSLQVALMTSESALAEERAMWAKSSDRLDTVLTSKESLEDEIQQLTDELEQVKGQLEVRGRQEEVYVQQNKDFHELQQQFNMLQQRYDGTLTELQTLKDSTVSTLEASLAKQKSEKKQLKAYALQLKADMERVTLERDTAAHEKEMAQIASSEWKMRVDVLEQELEELRNRNHLNQPDVEAPTEVQSDSEAAAAGVEASASMNPAADPLRVVTAGLTDSSSTHMASRIMIIGNEDEVDEPEEEEENSDTVILQNRTIDSSVSRNDDSAGHFQQQFYQQPQAEEEEDFYTNAQFEADVENVADTLVREFQEIKEKTMSIFPSWETILGEEEELFNGFGGGSGGSKRGQSPRSETTSTNVFGF